MDAAAALTTMGRATGVLGLLCFLAAAVPSARVPGTDRWFGGLTRLWRVHHLLGAASFLLVMAHPLLLAFAAMTVSRRAAAEALFPPGAPLVWAGWAAFAAMAVFLAPTFHFFGPPPYQRWKSAHALSGAALVLALAHAVPLARSVPGGAWLAGGTLAALSVVYRLFLARRLGCARYTVSAVESPGRGVVELSLTPSGRRVRFEAGQFVYLTPLDPGLSAGRGEEHPYTVSSAPDGPVLRLAIKDL
ncbi:MAG: ferric reductase-like transmembrane domain-containing protein, partial [Elusimicrobia bacterium]|nr:ferric reductase-like transmembrane domain-containing protein [Elusimicrobiota bacterium]